MSELNSPGAPAGAQSHDDGLNLSDLFGLLGRNALWLVALPLAAGALAVGASFFIRPVFTATTTFLPPQQQQSAMTAALSSLGPLSGLAGGAAGARNPGDQYVALMESVAVSNRIIDQFDLMKVYRAEFRIDAQRTLDSRVRVGLGKKDGLVTVSVDDTEPPRAASIANRYVAELRRMTSDIAITEAQQRRVFFEQKLQETRDKLTQAQKVLQNSGFNPGALRTEPKAATEGYARLQAEIASGEVRLQALRGALSDTTPEVQRQLNILGALRGQLARTSQPVDESLGPDYIGRYREFKYQEALFELFARQYEAARVDESKEGAIIQVIDEATPPERKSGPRRSLWGIGGAGISFVGVLTWLLLRDARGRSRGVPVIR